MTPAERDSLGRLMGDADARVERSLWRKVSEERPPDGETLLFRWERCGQASYSVCAMTYSKIEPHVTHWRYIDPPPGCAE